MFPIVEKLGGRDAVLEVLDRRLPRSTPRGPHTVIKWVTNKEIPARCRWALAEECSARGILYDFDDFKFVERASSKEAA
jgi:hypothetical protein